MADHRCLVCGKEYQHCDDCKKMREHFTPWKTICDTQQHFQVYSIFKDLKAKRISDEEAKSQLDHIGVNVDEVNTFNDSVKEILLPVFLGAYPAHGLTEEVEFDVAEQGVGFTFEVENDSNENVGDIGNDSSLPISQKEYSYSRRNRKRN